MTLGVRKLTVFGSVAAIIVLTNVWVIAGWLDHVGLIAWARSMRAEFITGTAITVIAALLVLLPSTARPSEPRPKRRCSCPVCDEGLRPGGRYCPACGSWV